MPRQRDASDSALVDSLIHQAPVGLAFLGPDLRFRRVNAALGQIVGKPEGDHDDKLPSDVWPEELAARAEAALRKVLAVGLPITETRFMTRGVDPPNPPAPGGTHPPGPPLGVPPLLGGCHPPRPPRPAGPR